MLKQFYFNQIDNFFQHIKPSGLKVEQIEDSVRQILENVEKSGLEAVRQYTVEFDKVALSLDDIKLPYLNHSLLNPAREIKDLTKASKKAISVAIENITNFHKTQINSALINQDLSYRGKYGEILSTRITPMERAGVYVPGGVGGNTPLISTALMNILPAKIAGVKEIVVTTPPMNVGHINEVLLYTLERLGIKEVYTCGGAQAIGLLAYGDSNRGIKPCDIIVGPGNSYVSLAKKAVFGKVMIDGVFGPSEIVIISEGKSKPLYTAYDLMSQSEHAGGELSVLLCTNEAYIHEVCQILVEEVHKAPRKKELLASLESRGASMLVKKIDDAIAISNRIAPEHLELDVEYPEKYLDQIKHAGAIFLGHLTPEPIGDYIAGTNHVLPTNGAARFSSPLGVYNFQKKSNVIKYTKEALQAYGPHAISLAKEEGLNAHAESVNLRLQDS